MHLEPGAQLRAAVHPVLNGEWDIAGLAKRSYDLEGKTVGIYGAGAIGQLVAMRLKPFDVKM